MVVQCLYEHVSFREVKALKAAKQRAAAVFSYRPRAGLRAARFGMAAQTLLRDGRWSAGWGSCLLRHAAVTGRPAELGPARAACQPGTVSLKTLHLPAPSAELLGYVQADRPQPAVRVCIGGTPHSLSVVQVESKGPPNKMS